MISTHLPLELINSILSRLPVKALIRLLSVSQEWSALINSSNFIKKHLNYSIETNSDRTLILKETFEDIAIWNPLIRKYRKLPSEPIDKPSDTPSGSLCYSCSSFGFGYDPSNDDYKVMRIAQFFEGVLREFFEMKVCSLKSQCWKKIEKQLPIKEICSAQSGSLNGAFHWIVEQDDGSESILAFDLANEKFRLYRKPSNEDLASLEVLGGCLCFIECCPEIPTSNDFWLMKEYGDESSWTRIYKIESDAVLWNIDYFKPLLFSKNGKKVLMEGVSLIWYDIKKKRGKKVKNRSFPKRFKTATCIESLPLLDGDNVIDPRQKKNKRKT
ncbi:hypothetical protein ACB092_11G075100 [Castanea dentata]